MRELLIGLFFLAIHTDALGASKWRQECALASAEFRKALPTENIDVWCANDQRIDWGTIGYDVVHVLAAGMFYDKRADRRVIATNLLETYECESLGACKKFLHLLNWGIKSSHPHPSIGNRANKLREKLRATIAQLEATPQSGVCRDQSVAEIWVENTFQKMCDAHPKKFPRSDNVFKSTLESRSGQLLLSSSRLMDTSVHSHCPRGAWETTLTCETSELTTNTFQCQNISGVVSCLHEKKTSQ
jgi:hypothetical protein